MSTKRRHRGQCVLGGAAVAAAVVATTAVPAAALTPAIAVSAPVQVSGDVPLAAGCSSNNGNGPHAAVDPAHPTHIAVVYSIGGVIADAVAASADGGASWSRQVLPGLTKCSNGDDGGPSDPMVAVGAGGDTITSVGWVTNDPSTDVDNTQGDKIRLLTNRSEKFGQPFADPKQPEQHGLDQRGPISFAPGSNSDALIAFERVHYVNNPEFDSTGGYVQGTGGSIGIAHSGTGGADWTDLPDAATGESGTDVATVALLRSGASVVLIYVVADSSTTPSYLAGQGLQEQLFSKTSTDDGQTWSDKSLIGTYFYPHATPRGCCIPDASVAPDGTLYAAWPHFDNAVATATRYDGIDIATSADAGQHWASTVVSGSQLGLGSGDVYEPAIAAGGHGSLGLLFYEADADKDPNLTPRIAASGDGGKTWAARPLAGTFPTAGIQDGNTDGLSKVGPYQDLLATADGFAAVVTLGAGATENVWWFSVKTRS